jgi:N-methylhydantoinase A/oxoprolinase/acetone carboxylase beta subunit
MPELAEGGEAASPEPGQREVYFEERGWLATKIYDRSLLRAGQTISGPAIIEEFDSTTLLPPDVQARIDRVGNIVIDTGLGH